MTYTPERIERERAICKAATPGPWEVDFGRDPGNAPWCHVEGWTDHGEDWMNLERADAEFIAAARTGWPEALAVIAAARAYVDAVADRDNSFDFVDARWREFRDALNGGAS